MSEEQKFLDVVKKLREIGEEKKRNFEQTVDLIINLKEFDIKKSAFNLFIHLPNKITDRKIAGFFERDSEIIKVIKKSDFPKFKEKKDIKRLIKNYDSFIANAKLMPVIAASFGRVLGPAGKMPSPQLGIINSEEEILIKDVINKINSSVRVIVKEPSIKIGIAKESLEDEKISQNALAAYRKILENLPRGKDNIKNVKIKLTMGRPVNIELWQLMK